MLTFLFITANFLYEERACLKAYQCNLITNQQRLECVPCVDLVYNKYKHLLPFTKKQVFNYVQELSCPDLKQKMDFYKIFECIQKYQ